MSDEVKGAGRIGIRYTLDRGGFLLNVDAGLSTQGITGIFGPSGAGKTSLLRCIAGLEDNASGSLTIDGETIEDSERGIRQPAHRRAIAYVFQEPRLFPHLNVRQNVEYGIRRAKPKTGIDFKQVTELLGLEKLLSRRPSGLSGGEAQRVAIARSLACSPRVVLMDEPVSALDAARRYEILPFVEKLHAELSIPVIYVSHNIEEICQLCDQMLVMEDGRTVAYGDLQEVLARTDIPVLGGDEAGCVVAAKAIDYDAEFDLTRVRVSGGELWVPGRLKKDASVRVRIRANDLSLCREMPAQTSILNRMSARVESIVDESVHAALVELRCGNDRLVARITRRSCKQLGLECGDDLIVQVKSVSVRRLTH